MIHSITTDLKDFGRRELAILADIINSWLEHELPKGFVEDEVLPMFNRNSGYVFLTNSEYQVAILNGNRLELFYTCGSCGHEGLRDDFDHNSNECCKEQMQDYGIDLNASDETHSSFYEKLHLTTDLRDLPNCAVELDTRRDIAIYDTLCLYCANNNINLDSVSDADFFTAVNMIEDYKEASIIHHDKMAFWIN